jgi:phosphoribosylformimino-5-aminoimidazole carboxamide ribotide isomerase
MRIIPSIDLYNGQCVRLKQGKFDAISVYSKNPQALAQHYYQQGARHLHLVDLDGAKAGKPQQLPQIQSLASLGLSIQAGGGIRSLDSAYEAIETGISKLVIGSMAITDVEGTCALIQSIQAQNIVLALDVFIDEKGALKPAIHAWQETGSKNVWDLLALYEAMGVQSVLCTDISRDGMMQGPNLALYLDACKRFPSIAWQASGGIRDIEDIRALNDVGVSAAILGRALYTEGFDLRACLEEFVLC